MKVLHKWPDGSFRSKPFKRTEPAKGALRFIRRVRYIFKIYSLIEVDKHYTGETCVAVTSNLKLVKLPEWQKNNPNRRFSSKK